MILSARQATSAPEPGAAADWLAAWIAEPVWIELAVVVAVALTMWWVWQRQSARGELARQRPDAREYLLGIEQALAADWRPARRRLQQVIETDPENLPARLVLADVLTRLGETVEAHRHHVYLQRGFGLVSQANDLALARILLRRGEAGQARAVLESAGGESTHRLRLACALLEPRARDLLNEDGNTETPRATVSGLADLTVDAEPMVAAAISRGRADAGLRALSEDRERAERLYRAAVAADATTVGVRALGAALFGSSAPELAAPDAAASSVVGPGSGTVQCAPDRAPRDFHCARCFAPSAARESSCPVCLAPSPFVVAEPALLARLPEPGLVLDAIEESPIHVQRLLEAAFDPRRPSEAAAKELSAIGPDALPSVLAAGAAAGERQQAIAVSVVHGMGPAAIEVLLHGVASAEQPMLGAVEPACRSNAWSLISRAVQSFGATARPAVERLATSRDREVRRLVLDFFITLGQEDPLHQLLAHFAPMELLHRLNEADPELLRSLLADARSGGLLMGDLLPDPAFRRELDVLFALPNARDPEGLCAVLEQRGPSRLLVLALLDSVSSPELQAFVSRLLRSFGATVIGDLVSAYADHDRSAADRAAIGARLTEIGPGIVLPVCRWIGPAPSSLDEDWIRLLGTLGSAASRSLSAAYEQADEVAVSGSEARPSNRRVVIVRSMAAAGARNALLRLRRVEDDPHLREHIERALDRTSDPRTQTSADEAVDIEDVRGVDS